MKIMLITVQKKLACYFYAFHKKMYGETFFHLFPYCQKNFSNTVSLYGKIGSFAIFV